MSLNSTPMLKIVPVNFFISSTSTFSQLFQVDLFRNGREAPITLLAYSFVFFTKFPTKFLVKIKFKKTESASAGTSTFIQEALHSNFHHYHSKQHLHYHHQVLAVVVGHYQVLGIVVDHYQVLGVLVAHPKP